MIKKYTITRITITGAARGLGREICIRLAKEGCTITCIDIILAGAKETAKLCNEIKSNCAEAHLCDITDRRKVAELVKLVKPVDVLINNAGIVSSADIMEVSDENIERMMNVNVMAQFWTSYAQHFSLIDESIVGKGALRSGYWRRLVAGSSLVEMRGSLVTMLDQDEVT
uniref:Uncharacterized protein n=1 Tax=Rhodnius prolixus TaxID=13249 RepID=T1HW39_RHOPR